VVLAASAGGLSVWLAFLLAKASGRQDPGRASASVLADGPRGTASAVDSVQGAGVRRGVVEYPPAAVGGLSDNCARASAVLPDREAPVQPGA
jgi:hypothetical protein